MKFLSFPAILFLLSSCSWLLEEPLPRTNPSDQNAAVFYFRAIPQYNGGSLDRVRLKWNWSESDPRNPGRVTILRKSTGYPQSTGDPAAVQVYSSVSNTVEYFDDTIGGTQSPGSTFYYTLFCDIDGFDDSLRLNSPPTEFSLQSTVLPASLEAAFGYDGTNYPIYGYVRIADTTAPFEKAVGAYAPDIGLLPGFNIDIYDTTLTYSNSGSLGFYIQRITRSFPDDAAASVYYNLLQDPGSYTTSGQVVEPATTGNLVSSPELEALLEYWLDTLDIYGFRIAPYAAGTNDLSAFSLTVDYVGPPPP